MTGWIQDARFSLRTLAKRPGFVAIVILVLGVGLGAVAIVFTVVNAMIYFPHAQYPRSDIYLVVRTPTVSAGLIDVLHREVSRLAPEQPLRPMIPLEQIQPESVWPRRTMAYLMSGFGVLALILALVGVCSLLAYGVVRRTRELGVRLALGAGPRDLLGGVLWEGPKTTLFGVALGAVAATFTFHLTASLGYGVSPVLVERWSIGG